MKKSDLREKIHLTSVDELFGLENAESSIEIEIDRFKISRNIHLRCRMMRRWRIWWRVSKLMVC